MAEKDDIAISIKNLHKDFLLPHERKNSLKEWVLHFKKPSFERMHALKDINVEIKRGEFFGIVGRNGSGKSTLIKIIGSIYQPTSGRLQVNGTLTPFIELGIGFNPELTGRDNIYLNGAILGLTRKEVKEKYDEIVAFSELERFMDQKLKNYSSGMQVRLAFSIAIQAHNDILLIDEVLAVGDSAFQRKCFNVFKEVKKQGKTVVFVTHDMGAVQEFCDRAMMIQNSEIVITGSPRDVALRYEVANAAQEKAALKENTISRPKDPAVKLKSIRTRNEKNSTTHFSRDDDIIVDVNFEAKEIKEPIQFNLFFLKEDGKYLAGINTTDDLGPLKPKPGNHTVSCTIRAGQLPKSSYLVNAGVHSISDPPRLIDILDVSYGADVPRITILERSRTQDGEFYINGNWSQTKG
jgi:ABC-2 type transport system ATP-binding protein